MKTMIINMSLFFVILIICYYYFYSFFKKNKSRTYIIKIVLSSLFVIIGINSFINSEFNTIKLLLFIGVLLCLIGDILLGLRFIFYNHKIKFLFLGMISFFCSHIMYAISFFLLSETKAGILLLSIVLLYSISLAILKYTNVKFGKLLVPCLIYMLTATSIFSLAILTLINNYSNGILLLFIGVVSFVISDIFLAYSMFNSDCENIKIIKFISIYSYFPAIAIIAQAIYFI